jgi:hypothetical protein
LPPPTANGQSKTKSLFGSAMSMWRNHKKIMLPFLFYSHSLVWTWTHLVSKCRLTNW